MYRPGDISLSSPGCQFTTSWYCPLINVGSHKSSYYFSPLRVKTRNLSDGGHSWSRLAQVSHDTPTTPVHVIRQLITRGYAVRHRNNTTQGSDLHHLAGASRRQNSASSLCLGGNIASCAWWGIPKTYPRLKWASTFTFRAHK